MLLRYVAFAVGVAVVVVVVVVCCLLLVVVVVVGCWVLLVGCWLVVVDWLLFVVRCLLFAACCLLLVACVAHAKRRRILASFWRARARQRLCNEIVCSPNHMFPRSCKNAGISSAFESTMAVHGPKENVFKLNA